MAKKIDVQGNEIRIISRQNEDYISLTDIAKYRNKQEPFAIINNWMRNRSTIEFLGLWETLSNAAFKPLEFERFRNEAGSNYFVLSPQRWIETTHAVGLVSKSGRYGGTFAHQDIAFEFASWISPQFKLYLIKEFQRLKNEERKQLGWDRTDRAPDQPDLCLGGRCPEHGSLRQDGQTVAWQPSGPQGQHLGSRERLAARLPVQSGESQCPVHPGEHAAGRTPGQTQPDRHQPDEAAHKRYRS